MKRALLIVLLVLVADQALKIWVKLHFYYDSAISILGDKGYLHFIENRGMAFGMEFGGDVGKLMLTLFRIIAVIVILIIIRRSVSKGASTWTIVSLALIMAGALGNIIDSTFYGLIFSESTPFQKAVLFPPGGGYAPLFHGAVVDMFYFPLWEGRLPDWLPFWGGQTAVFFRPVFNLADASITVGMVLFILLQRKQGHRGPEVTTDTAPTFEAPGGGVGTDPAAQ